VSTQALDHEDPAVIYDCAMRFTIPSRSRANETHIVDLDCYSLNGKCSCEHFQFNLEPLLARQATPEDAISSGAIKLRKNQHPDDALRCNHIVDAYRQFSVVAARAISTAKRLNYETHLPPPSF
jgi:hypothetical protein